MQPSYGSVSDLVKDKVKCDVGMVENEAQPCPTLKQYVMLKIMPC
jgi:hypothetical protein